MWSVDEARDFAIAAHDGQTDKAGRPYVEHLREVAEGVDTEAAQTIAWLHDVLEDTETTPGLLAALGVSPAQLRVLDALTHRPNEPYWDYIGRVIEAGNLAVRVKLADLESNLDPERFEELDEVTRARLLAKYLPAKDRLARQLRTKPHADAPSRRRTTSWREHERR